MTDATPPRLTHRQRWHRLRTSPRFPFVLFFGLLVAGGLSQVYCYWWGVRIQRMVARHGGNVSTKPIYPYSLKQTVGARFIEPLEPINGVSLSPKSPVPASDLALLDGLWSLSGLGLHGPIAPDGWQQVGRLCNLRAINVMGPNLVVRDRDMEQLARLPKLTSLSLAYMAIEPQGLRHFASHSSLTRLYIECAFALEPSDTAESSGSRRNVHVVFDAASLRELAAQRTLKKLTFFDCHGFDDEHLLSLTSTLPDGTEPLPSLTMLHLIQTGVTGDGVRFLGNLSKTSTSRASSSATTDCGD